MVANRACAPCSKLYCWEQWLKEEVHIPGTQGLSLQHLYRAMDFLEANKEPIEREIFHRVADLLNLDVEVLFYDTTSLHFEIDLDDEGVGAEDLVHGSKAAGAKAYRAPRKRGLSKNGRGDAPQIVVGMAVTREGFPVRHWVFPGNTVDVTKATYANSIGSPELMGSWTDPAFDPKQHALYYVRVLEIPTPRWTTYDAVRNNLPPLEDVPATIQERAWTSPIWYTPQ